MTYIIEKDDTILTYTDAEEANDFIHQYLKNTDYGIVGIKYISDTVIIMYCDVV